MDKKNILQIVENLSITNNRDLYTSREELIQEFEKTKKLIVDLTHHLDAIEDMYNKINDEIKNRVTV